MRTITVSIPDGVGVTARLVDETGKQVDDVIRVEFEPIVPMHPWQGTLHFSMRSRMAPEDVNLVTA